VTTNNEKIDFGTRQYEGYPYLFVANSSGQTQTVTFDLSDLEIPNASVRDYNYNTIVGSIINNSLTLTLPNDAGQLLKIDALIPAHLLLPSDCLPPPITNFEACDPAVYAGLQEIEQVEKLLKKVVTIENKPNSQLTLSPNPFDSKVTFLANNLLGKVDIQVYNALGQLMYSKTGVESTSLEIQTDNWQDGLYIFNITYSNPDLRSENKLESLRMIK